MMLSPSRSGGSVTERSVTGSCREVSDATSMEPSRFPTLVNIAHFRKVNVLVEAQPN
jgi:hypothetical protein